MQSATRNASSLLALALSICVLPSAWAVEPLDTFSARIGGYVSTFDTEVRADGETSNGTDVDLERDLGLDEEDAIGYVGLTWRPWERHELGFSYYGTDLEGTRVLERDINFDGEVYEASATVRTEFSVDAYEAYYVWWAASHDDWALGPRLGLIWYRASIGLQVTVDAGGEQGEGSASSSVSADLPAPTIGGSWRWTPADDWRISADAGYFAADINGIDANVTFGRAGVEWFPWDRVGFSLDYIISNIEADADKDSFRGHFDFVDSGVRL
ncbi:MAG: hypothetical protein ABWY94_00560, partial [Pseudoxanthomonas sp.]